MRVIALRREQRQPSTCTPTFKAMVRQVLRSLIPDDSPHFVHSSHVAVSLISNRKLSGHLRELDRTCVEGADQFDGSRENTDSYADGEDDKMLASPTTDTEKQPRRSSFSSLSQVIANRVAPSTVFPTVVHRPRKRPSIARMNISVAPTTPIGQPGALQESPDDTNSSNPSHYYNSTSPISQASTAKTSVFSDTTSPRSADSRKSFKKHDLHNKEMPTEPFEDALSTIEEVRSLEAKTPPLQFPVQDAPLLNEPTVSSVEKAAATKAFFELHYNSLLNGPIETSRAQRRQELERNLCSRGLSLADRQQARQEWAQAESNNLRQARVLKTRSIARQHAKGISIAGYEQVRVLGKGSFGVVKLVRESSQETQNPSGQSCTASSGSQTRACVGVNGAAPAFRDQTKDIFAMKVIRKSDMLRNCQEGHLRAERDFLIASQHSIWVVPLISSFQDSTNLYLVMEYMVGGDFLGLLLREDVVDEYVARWYLAEMVLCIEETHRLRWIHRDVKPDNFLIASNGHLKISDFGLAFDGHWAHNQSYYKTHRYDLIEKLGIEIEGDEQDKDDERSSASESPCRLPSVLRRDSKKKHDHPILQDGTRQEGILDYRNRRERRRMANSVVGTSQYMAPEVIRGEQYDGRCDWWSIGIILYEACSEMKRVHADIDIDTVLVRMHALFL